MKRIIAAFLIILITLSASSCTLPFLGDIFGSDGGDSLNLGSGYTIVYNRASDSDERMEAMVKEGIAEIGGKVDSNPNKLKSFDKEIILGGVDFKEETKALAKDLEANTNDLLGAFAVRTIGKKVFVYASCPEAEKLAVDTLFSYTSDGKLILPVDLDVTTYFNLYEYKSTGELLTVSDGVEGVAEPVCVKIKDTPVPLAFGKYDYQMSSEPTEAFPTEEEIEVLLYSDGMSYDISYSGKSVVITVNSKDGENSNEYRFTYGFEDEYTVSSTIVNKNGAKGVLSMISDDGNQRTADFFYTVVAPRYSSFKISIAAITNNIASLKASADGKAWLMDDDGNYVLQIRSNSYVSMINGSVFTGSAAHPTQVDFWNQITSGGQIEIISHTHTHGLCGTTDEQNGSYPAGNVIKEIRASAQILRDLLGQNSPFIARAGGAFWPNDEAFRSYFYNLVSDDPSFVGMRTSSGNPPLPGASSTKLNSPEQFADAFNRLNIGCLLVKGNMAAFNADGTGFAFPSGGKIRDVIEAGVGAWTNYVDLAIKNGKWASIAFHSVFDDTRTSNMSDGYEVADSQVIAFMEYVQPLVDSGDLWVGSFSEVAEYYFQWSTAEVSARAYGDERVEVTLTDREEDARMDSELTVKVNVPGNWTAAELDSYGAKTPLEVHVDDNGECFVYANILPGDGVSVIRPAN